MKKITVTIGRDGSTKVEADGYSGGECLEATKAIEAALGEVDERETKPEMYGEACVAPWARNGGADE